MDETRLATGMLIDALQLLAADAADQIRAFPSFVCIADEIALTFNDAVLLCLQNAEEDGTPEWLIAAVKEIDETFDALSGSVATDFWTAAALKMTSDGRSCEPQPERFWGSSARSALCRPCPRFSPASRSRSSSLELPAWR